MSTRNTIQRTLVLKTVRELRSHVTADEVHDVIAREHPDIGRGTVYRNLNVLSDTGEIRRVEVPNGATRYDYQCHEHYHAKCDQCEQIFDVDMDFLANLEGGIRNSSGFVYTGHDIIFRGICPECNIKI